MANDYTFNQVATILNQIVQAAQGRAANDGHDPIDTSEFVSIANTAITSVGLDPIMDSVTQMINRTIFVTRPYAGKFRILENSEIGYGNAIRKLTPIFHDAAEDQPMYNDIPADGQSVDMYVIKRPKTVQTHIVGAEQYAVQAPSVFIDQLKSAFRGPDELIRFLDMQTTETQNEINQHRETLARNTVANLIGNLVLKGNTYNHIHLLTEYNNLTGLELDAETIYIPDNFVPFIKWMYARMNEVSDRLTNRTDRFNLGLPNLVILRHTPKNDQRLLLYAPFMRQIETMALSGIYHDDLLTMAKYEGVDFWQDFEYPDRVDVTPSTLNVSGAPVKGTAVSQDKIVGLLYDRNAMGTNTFSEAVDVTRPNAKARYYNTFHHIVKRYWNDTTENAVLFTLD